MAKPISERTLLEMTVGKALADKMQAGRDDGWNFEMTTTKKQAFESRISHSKAWGLAGNYEKSLARLVKKAGMILTVHAIYRDSTEEWVLRTQIYEGGNVSITFEPESYTIFPSDKLKAQIMLVAG